MNKIKLRYLQTVWHRRRYDDRDKEWSYYGNKNEPILQYLDGKKWIEPKLIIVKKYDFPKEFAKNKYAY